MNNFKLLHETPDHFVLHNGKASFHVAKKGISEPTADKIRSFANGGAVEQKESFQLEEPPKADLEDIYKPTELPEPEKPEKRREIETEMPEPTAMAKGGATPPPQIGALPGEQGPQQNIPLKFAEGGKLTAEDRKHIASKNFAGPDRSYPIEDASHARNALARVSQHGSPELQAQVRAKVHSKYPGIEQSHAEGGSIPYRKPEHYADGGDTDQSGLWDSIKQAFNTPAPQQPAEDKDAQNAEIRRKSRLSVTDPSNPEAYAMGGNITDPKQVHNISNESQPEAIKRYADGNPATLAKGGHVHHNAGKNQLHFHFYDGAVVPTQLDKEEGAGPQQPSALDKYVGGEPAQGTPLDNYADGGEAMSDSDKLANAAQDLQAGLNSQTPPASTSDSSEETAPAETAPVVPQAQQIPAAQKALPPTPDQSPTMLSDFDKSLSLEKSGIEQGAQAQTEGYKQTAQAIGQNVLQQKQQMDAYKLESDKLTQQNTQLFNAVASSKIDPDHYWNSKSTGGKIMASIGLILGGIAGGINGTNQNQALAMLQNHVQQDIEAQKNDQSNKMNLYKIGLEKYRDSRSAQQFATLQSNALLQGQLQKIAAQTGSQTAQATANQMIGQLGVQNTGIRSDLAMKQAAFGAMNQPQAANAGVDPNKMRLLINAGVIPKEEVPAAMKEYSDYTKLNDTLDHTDDVFKQAAANSTYTERALPGWTPTLRDKSKQYEAVTDAWLGNITKDTEGRVTPADIQLMKASLPKAGDNPQLIQSKLANIKDMIRQKYAFPTLQSYRLLHPNNAISTPGATRQKRFTEGPPK